MSCLNANIAFIKTLKASVDVVTKNINANTLLTKGISVSITNITDSINANTMLSQKVVAHCLLACGVHNSVNLLTNNWKILFDGDKLLLV